MANSTGASCLDVIVAGCVSRQIHPPVPWSSFIGARRVNLSPPVFHLPPMTLGAAEFLLLSLAPTSRRLLWLSRLGTHADLCSTPCPVPSVNSGVGIESHPLHSIWTFSPSIAMGTIHGVKRETVTESQLLYIFFSIFSFFLYISFFSREKLLQLGERIFLGWMSFRCEIRGVFIPSKIVFEIPQVFILLVVWFNFSARRGDFRIAERRYGFAGRGRHLDS